MNPLLPHIVYLLRRHDCVIIPSIGAFIAGRRHAMLDFEAGKVFPPMREVMFNASILNNDGLLANSIARRQRISYPEGLQLVNDAAARMRRRLLEEGSLRLPHLGTLNLGREGNIIFRPEETAAENAYRRGMMPVVYRRQPEEAAAETVETPAATPVRDRRYYYFRIRKSAVKVAAALVGVVLLVAAAMQIPVSNTVGPTPVKEEKASVIPIPQQKPQPAPAATLSPDSAKYHIVVGAFHTEEEATNFMQDYQGKGFELRLLRANKYIHVTVDRDNDKRALRSRLTSHPLDTTFRHPWILTRN